MAFDGVQERSEGTLWHAPGAQPQIRKRTYAQALQSDGKAFIPVLVIVHACDAGHGRTTCSCARFPLTTGPHAVCERSEIRSDFTTKMRPMEEVDADWWAGTPQSGASVSATSGLPGSTPCREGARCSFPPPSLDASPPPEDCPPSGLGSNTKLAIDRDHRPRRNLLLTTPQGAAHSTSGSQQTQQPARAFAGR